MNCKSKFLKKAISTFMALALSVGSCGSIVSHAWDKIDPSKSSDDTIKKSNEAPQINSGGENDSTRSTTVITDTTKTITKTVTQSEKEKKGAIRSWFANNKWRIIVTSVLVASIVVSETFPNGSAAGARVISKCIAGIFGVISAVAPHFGENVKILGQALVRSVK